MTTKRIAMAVLAGAALVAAAAGGFFFGGRMERSGPGPVTVEEALGEGR
jgi:hypothetical protein